MNQLDDSPQVRRTDELPFIDAHSIEVNAPPDRAWDTLLWEVLSQFGGGWGRVGTGRVGRVGARMLGAPYAEPPAPGAGVPDTIVGFRVERAERPSLIELTGEHRFAAYTLTLSIEPAGDESKCRLTAQTRAEFPGAAGRLYRAAVIGTGMHRRVVRRLLRGINGNLRTAEAPPAGTKMRRTPHEH